MPVTSGHAASGRLQPLAPGVWSPSGGQVSAPAAIGCRAQNATFCIAHESLSPPGLSRRTAGRARLCTGRRSRTVNKHVLANGCRDQSAPARTRPVHRWALARRPRPAPHAHLHVEPDGSFSVVANWGRRFALRMARDPRCIRLPRLAGEQAKAAQLRCLSLRYSTNSSPCGVPGPSPESSGCSTKAVLVAGPDGTASRAHVRGGAGNDQPEARRHLTTGRRRRRNADPGPVGGSLPPGAAALPVAAK